jgi:hypothetical protein
MTMSSIVRETSIVPGFERSEGLHKLSAEDFWETPCAAPGQRPQRGLVSLSRSSSTQELSGRVAAGTGR